jgi:hypothetical protein
MVVYSVVATTIQGRALVRPEDWADGVVCFDSFSEPSLACAILSQEADRLVAAYCDRWNQEQLSHPGPIDGGREILDQPRKGEEASALPAGGKEPGLQRSAIESIAALDAKVQNLSLGLGARLLLVYAMQHAWNEFVDCYLRFVREAPGRAEVSLWARTALDNAQKCGRSEEVADALQRIVRFHPELKTTAGLRAVLAQWKTPSPVGPETRRQ